MGWNFGEPSLNRQRPRRNLRAASEVSKPSMKADRLSWTSMAGWSSPAPDMIEAQLVLYWGASEYIASGERFTQLQEMFPGAAIVGCSTGGQILAGDVCDERVAAMAFRFEKTKIAVVEKDVDNDQCSFSAGAAAAGQLMRPDLKFIFVLSDGIHINGSDLVAGISSSIGPNVIVTGGLAGDGTRFQETLVGACRAPRPRQVAAIGFYGHALSIGHGSAGGWDEFGPKRTVSKSERNVLFTLNEEPVLDLYATRTNQVRGVAETGPVGRHLRFHSLTPQTERECN